VAARCLIGSPASGSYLDDVCSGRRHQKGRLWTLIDLPEIDDGYGKLFEYQPLKPSERLQGFHMDLSLPAPRHRPNDVNACNAKRYLGFAQADLFLAVARPYGLRIYAVSRSTDYEISPSLFGNVGGKVIGFLAAQ
jgi:hypothetical protein